MGKDGEKAAQKRATCCKVLLCHSGPLALPLGVAPMANFGAPSLARLVNQLLKPCLRCWLEGPLPAWK